MGTWMGDCGLLGKRRRCFSCQLLIVDFCFLQRTWGGSDLRHLQSDRTMQRLCFLLYLMIPAISHSSIFIAVFAAEGTDPRPLRVTAPSPRPGQVGENFCTGVLPPLSTLCHQEEYHSLRDSPGSFARTQPLFSLCLVGVTAAMLRVTVWMVQVCANTVHQEEVTSLALTLS